MNSRRILKETIQLFINESITESGLDAAWSISPLATFSDVDDDSDNESDELKDLQKEIFNERDCTNNQINSLRSYINVFLENKRRQKSVNQTDSAGPGVSTDPTQSKEPYDNYNIERGVDIHGYWYKSPGDKSTGGNYRPDDPAEYIGMKAPPAPSEPAEAINTSESDKEDDDVIDELHNEEKN